MIYTHVLHRGGKGVRSPADPLSNRRETRALCGLYRGFMRSCIYRSWGREMNTSTEQHLVGNSDLHTVIGRYEVRSL